MAKKKTAKKMNEHEIRLDCINRYHKIMNTNIPLDELMRLFRCVNASKAGLARNYAIKTHTNPSLQIKFDKDLDAQIKKHGWKKGKKPVKNQHDGSVIYW